MHSATERAQAVFSTAYLAITKAAVSLWHRCQATEVDSLNLCPQEAQYL
jgi:hypothetical protein